MSDFVRVRVKATGGQTSFHRTTVEAEPDLYDVLDKPAVDASGAPLPPKASVAPPKSPAAKKAADSSQPSTETPDRSGKKE